MHRTQSVSAVPQQAPADHRALPAKVVTKDGEGLWETWHGAGVPTPKPCAACANTEGNLQVYGNWGHSYPNGNSWDDWELLCAACGNYTYVCTFQEG